MFGLQSAPARLNALLTLCSSLLILQQRPSEEHARRQHCVAWSFSDSLPPPTQAALVRCSAQSVFQVCNSDLHIGSPHSVSFSSPAPSPFQCTLSACSRNSPPPSAGQRTHHPYLWGGLTNFCVPLSAGRQWASLARAARAVSQTLARRTRGQNTRTARCRILLFKGIRWALGRATISI